MTQAAGIAQAGGVGAARRSMTASIAVKIAQSWRCQLLDLLSTCMGERRLD